MKARFIIVIVMITLAAKLAYGQTFPIPESIINSVFHGRDGAFFIIECVSGNVSDFRPEASSEALPPCSTFKIWNTLTGLEIGIISNAEDNFYKWDEINRAFSGWNRDLTLKEAFQVSCVPAFQNLARQIGHDHMQLCKRSGNPIFTRFIKSAMVLFKSIKGGRYHDTRQITKKIIGSKALFMETAY